MAFNDLEKETMAISSIRYYLNVQNNTTFTDAYIKGLYPLVVRKIIEDTTSIELSKMVGVKSVSEGSQSVTFNDNTEAYSINSSIKNMLPKPYVMGW